MKNLINKNFFFCFIIFWSLEILSQNSKPSASSVQIIFFKKEYKNASVLLNSGETLLGEIQDFESPNTIEIVTPNFNISDIEANLNLDRKKIKFRKNENDSYINLPSESINQISLFDNDLNEEIVFKRLEIVGYINGEIKKRDREVFLPLIKSDSINLFGYHLYSNGRYSTTIVYLNNPKTNQAITPFEVSLMELAFNKNLLSKKFTESFRFASENCKPFMEWLDETMINNIIKKSEAKEKYKNLLSQIKEGKKKLKTNSQKTAFELKKYEEYYILPFVEIINEYKQKCK